MSTTKGRSDDDFESSDINKKFIGSPFEGDSADTDKWQAEVKRVVGIKCGEEGVEYLTSANLDGDGNLIIPHQFRLTAVPLMPSDDPTVTTAQARRDRLEEIKMAKEHNKPLNELKKRILFRFFYGGVETAW